MELKLWLRCDNKFFKLKWAFFPRLNPFVGHSWLLLLLRFALIRENKLFNFFIICKQFELVKWMITFEIYPTAPILVWKVRTLYFHKVMGMKETDFCSWFSCGLPKKTAFALQTLLVHFEPKSCLVLSKFDHCWDFHKALYTLRKFFTKPLTRRVSFYDRRS